MFLSTIHNETEIRYREHRIPVHPRAADEYFEEVCEHVSAGGVRVRITEEIYDYPDWW